MRLNRPTYLSQVIYYKTATEIQNYLRSLVDENKLYLYNSGLDEYLLVPDKTLLTVTRTSDSRIDLYYNGTSATFATPEHGADAAYVFNFYANYNSGTVGNLSLATGYYWFYTEDYYEIAVDTGEYIYVLNTTYHRQDLPVYHYTATLFSCFPPTTIDLNEYSPLSSTDFTLNYTFKGNSISRIPTSSNYNAGTGVITLEFRYNWVWAYSQTDPDDDEYTQALAGTLNLIPNAKLSNYYKPNNGYVSSISQTLGFIPDTALSLINASISGLDNSYTVLNTFPDGYWKCRPMINYIIPEGALTYSGTAATSVTLTTFNRFDTTYTGTTEALTFLGSYSNYNETATYSGSLSTTKYLSSLTYINCTETLSYTVGTLTVSETRDLNSIAITQSVDSYFEVSAGFTGSSASTYQSTAPAVYVSEGTESYSVTVTSTSNDRRAIRNYVINSLNNESYLNCTNWNRSNDRSQRISWEEETLQWFVSEGPRTISCSNIDYGLDTGWSAVWEIDYNGLADNYGTTYNAVSLYEYSTDIPNNPSVTYNSEDALITLTHSYQFDKEHYWTNEYTLYYTYSNEHALIPYSSSSSQTFRTVAESDHIWVSVNHYETVRYSLTATGSHGEYYTYNTNSLMTYPEATVIRSVTRV